MRYYILAVMALVAMSCSDSTSPEGKPYKLYLHYAAPGCGRILVTGGGHSPYTGMEPGQTITLGWDEPYTSYGNRTIKPSYTWQKSGDGTVRGGNDVTFYTSRTVAYDTIRCSP